jgi:hypothetical protein
MDIKINVKKLFRGKESASERIKEMLERVKDFTNVLTLVKEDIWETNYNIFQNQGAFDGRGRWPDAHPYWIEHKRREGLPTTSLIFKKRLMYSLSGIGKESDRIAKVTKKGLIVGTKVPYAEKLVLNLKKFDLRPSLLLSDKQRKRYQELIGKFVLKGFVR